MSAELVTIYIAVLLTIISLHIYFTDDDDED